jgi:3'-phosphoadenosine 5'-phosphosulfate (PAPS) 3'-phosphatase
VSKLSAIEDVLREAVIRGAAEVLSVRREGSVSARIKYGRELVTAADERSDAAILSVFRSRLPSIDSSISFHLEESGVSGSCDGKLAGADPLDGTAHFACGGNLYAVQAHYVEDGVALVGVVFQPEVYLPLRETERCVGRLVSAVRGRGAFCERTESREDGFRFSDRRQLIREPQPRAEAVVACVPYSTKMAVEARELVRRVQDSGLIAATTGAGCASGNVMMTIFGGQHVYANLGAGEDLDLIPPQVIAEEAGLTVWGVDRKPPIWMVRKQPVVFAPDAETAEAFLRAGGL